MKTKIIYFSRTGHSKRIAEKIGLQIQATVYELKDNMVWTGFAGLLRALKSIRAQNDIVIQYDSSILDCDYLIVLSPIWGGQEVPSIKAFLSKIEHPNMSLVVINMGSDISIPIENAERNYPNIKSVYGITRKLKNEDTIINHLLNDKRDVYH
ncbi:MAG: flavodoxin family protein [Clostridia bacterium]|nr:flavodoxin family protein [Clostridia bacterium]